MDVASIEANIRGTNINEMPNERRSDPRFLVNEDFQVKILFSSDDPRMLGKTFACSAIDVSKNGVQVISEQPLAEKSVLDLSIKVNGSNKEYLVTGDVKWCRPGSGISHAVGIQLKKRSGTPTDLADWKSLVKHLK